MKRYGTKHRNSDKRYYRRSLVRGAGMRDRIGQDCPCGNEVVEMCAEDGLRIPHTLRGLAEATSEQRRKNIAALRGLGYTPLSEAFDKKYVHPKAKRKLTIPYDIPYDALSRAPTRDFTVVAVDEEAGTVTIQREA